MSCARPFQLLFSDSYKGNFANGKFHGEAAFSWARGHGKYTGEFKVGKYDGQGILIFSNGNKYVGEFSKVGIKHIWTYDEVRLLFRDFGVVRAP